jgi:VanZ family protein
LWCALIFTLSAQPHLELVDRELLDLVLRKTGHAVEYGVLALLASMTVAPGPSRPPAARWAAWAFAVAYAMSDEFHQTFVAGRMGQPRDVAIDAVGATIALVVAARWRAARSKVTTGKEQRT